jgi:hypothetical protein
MSDLQKDIEALERVLFRLASVDDERMLQVLQSLLPQLLTLFPRSLASPLELQLKDKVRLALYLFTAINCMFTNTKENLYRRSCK